MEKEVKRIIEISKKKGLSHISSCVSVLPILDYIYKARKDGDKLMMSGGHAHLAHLVIREKYEGLKNIEELIEKDIHCSREVGCDVTTGSLGHSGIAIGMALASPNNKVYLVMTDGSLGEGSEWEALRIAAELNLPNLEIHVNVNGFTAVSPVNRGWLEERLKSFYPPIHIWQTENPEGFEGIGGHYQIP